MSAISNLSSNAMTPFVLSTIPFLVVLGAFALCRAWLAKQPDRLAARHRALGVLIWVLGVVMLAAFVLSYSLPRSGLHGSIGFSMAVLAVFAIWQRQRLSRQLNQREDKHAGQGLV